MIRLNGGQNQFWGQNGAQKSQNCPKFITHKLLVIESWLTSQNDCNTSFTEGGPYDDEIAGLSISRKLPVV